ncbi:unnamed protein product [Penicillium glandicola]
MSTSSKYPNVLSPNGKSKGFTPSSGLTKDIVCVWEAETTSVEGISEYAGSNKAVAVVSPEETGYSYNEPGAECESEPCPAPGVKPDITGPEKDAYVFAGDEADEIEQADLDPDLDFDFVTEGGHLPSTESEDGGPGRGRGAMGRKPVGVCRWSLWVEAF